MIADKKREKKENRRTKETMKGSQNMIKACIFDLDGTLLDSAKRLPAELRETALGGCAATPAACAACGLCNGN